MASLEHYRKIIEEFCEITQIQDVANLFEHGQINVRGLDMLLFYDEEFDPARLQIRVDLQKPPHSGRSVKALLTALLVSNYGFGMGGLFVFGINPHDGHVVLTVQQMIDAETTGQALLESLQGIAAQAEQVWQQICDELKKMNQAAPLGKSVRV